MQVENCQVQVGLNGLKNWRKPCDYWFSQVRVGYADVEVFIHSLALSKVGKCRLNLFLSNISSNQIKIEQKKSVGSKYDFLPKFFGQIH